MKRQLVWRLVGVLPFLLASGWLAAAESGAQEEASPGPNTSEEPMRGQFSPEAAVRFLDKVAGDWQQKEKCLACHTNYAYLLARPSVAWDVPAHQRVRAAVELATEEDRSQAQEPVRSSQTVLQAAALAINDAQTTGQLHPTTRRALDRMWTMRRDDGWYLAVAHQVQLAAQRG